ncbi:MAG: IS1182 family transposase [archaeon]|nr:IS1182 family transposase [archaeon]
MAYIKSYPSQDYLFPPRLTDLFSDKHVCYLIQQITNDLDFSSFDEKYAGAGHPAYHPRIPLKILLMASVDGIRSSRKIAKNACENAVYIYLSEKTVPDFRTISDFRRNNKDLLKQVSLQLNKFALDKGLIDLSHLSIDGTSIKANANNKKSVDRETLEKLSKYIEEQIEEGIKVDEEEDKIYGDLGMNQLPIDLDNEEKRKPFVKQMVEEINKSMKEGNKEKVEEIKENIDDIKEKLDEKKQGKYSPTDPDSRFMLNKKGGKELSYNAQLVVDKNGIILFNDVVRETEDRNQLLPNVDGVERDFGKLPEGTKIVADPGYEKAKAIKELDDRGLDVYVPGKVTDKSKFYYDENTDVYISPNGEILKKIYTYFHKKQKRVMTIYRGIADGKEREIHALPEHKVLEKIRGKLRTDEGKYVFGLRKQTVEPCFGDLKENKKFRSFNLRGIEGVRNEFSLACTAHNLVRINNMLSGQPT